MTASMVHIHSWRKASAGIFLLLAGLCMGAGADAQGYLPPSGFVGGSTGPNGAATFQYANGVTVTFATTTTASAGIDAYRVRVADSTLDGIGTPLDAHFTGAVATSPAVQLDVWGAGCAVPGTDPLANDSGVVCGARGTLTVTFSQPVTDPVIHLGGLGTNEGTAADSMRYAARYSLASAANGMVPVVASLAHMSGNTRFSVVAGNVVAVAGPMNTMSVSCAANQAGCGSVRINGRITQAVFNISLSGHGAAGYTNSQDQVHADGHTVSASIFHQPDFGSCDGRMWLSQATSATPGQQSRLYAIDTGSNPFQFDLIGSTLPVYNALGYNPLDNYMYATPESADAALPPGNLLLRVGSDAQAHILGPVANLPDTSYNSGTFGPDGTYYVKPTGNNANLYAIDVDALEATPIALNASLALADMGFVGGTMYAVAANGSLYRINHATGAVTLIGGSGVTSPPALGAQFGAPNGFFGSANNGSGFYQVNLATGAWTLISGSPGSTVNDGANCPTANITFAADLYIQKDDGETVYIPGEQVQYTIVAGNSGPFGAAGVTVSDPLPAGITTASWTCAGASGGVCGSASGSGAINDTGVSLPVGGTVTYTLTLDVPTDFTGVLANTATVTPGPSTVDPDPDNNTDEDVNQPSTVADLWLTKTSNVDEAIIGTEVTYEIVLGNNGSIGVENAIVRDEPLPGLANCELAPPPACEAVTGAPVCPNAGNAPGELSMANLLSDGVWIPSLPRDSSIRLRVTCDVE